MDYQEQILSFLKKTENLSVALEVIDLSEKLQESLYQDFQQEVGEALGTRLRESAFADRWGIFNEFKEKPKDEIFRSFIIAVKPLPDPYNHHKLAVGLMPNPTNLLYGLLWHVQCRQNPNSEAFRALLESSRKWAGFPENKKDEWWPSYGYFRTYSQKDGLIREYGLNPEFVEELVKQIWDYFTCIEPELYKINQALLNGSL